MSLPPEIRERMKKSGDVKVAMKSSQGDQAIIEGKTGISFGTFVKLVLQRKVQTLFKDWQEEPVIISSELLTRIASAPQDSHEDKSKVILTALVIGMSFGFCLLSIAMIAFSLVGITIGTPELLTGLGVLLVLALAVLAALKVHTHKIKQDLVEKVEQISGIFSR